MNNSAMSKQSIKLKEDNSSYALDKTKEVLGYFKIDMMEGASSNTEYESPPLFNESCFMSLVLDNIKFFPNGEYIYTLVLAGTKDEKRCYYLVGTITTSPHGHGEASFCVNSSNLDGRGSRLTDFSTVIIAAMSTLNNRESLHPVLKGSLPPYEKSASAASHKETASSAASHKETATSAASHKEPEISAAHEKHRTTHTAPHPDPHPDNGKKDTRSIRIFNSFYNRILIENCIELAKRQDEFADIVPFAENLLEIVWKRIPDYCQLPMISPGAKTTIVKYGHFLWGYNDNHYFIAVPGRNLSDEQPDLGRSGFIYWQPILGMEDVAKDTSLTSEERQQKVYGYWLLAINRYNGYIEEFPLIEE